MAIMKMFLSKIFIVIISMAFLGIIQAMEVVETNGLQILINPSADWFRFKAEVNGQIIRDLITPRPAGSTFKEKCLIFPKNTIDVKNQESFLYDQQGNFLTKEMSVGMWKCVGKALVETSLANAPTVGTCFEESTWHFYFNASQSNRIKAQGLHTVVNTFQPRKKIVQNELTLINTNENKEQSEKKVHGKVYMAPDGKSFVINVIFDEKITVTFVQ